MKPMDVNSHAERLLRLHGATADLEALKRADEARFSGDRSRSEMWMTVADRVREMQNVRHIDRSA